MYCYIITGTWKSDNNNQPDNTCCNQINRLPLYNSFDTFIISTPVFMAIETKLLHCKLTWCGNLIILFCSNDNKIWQKHVRIAHWMQFCRPDLFTELHFHQILNKANLTWHNLSPNACFLLTLPHIQEIKKLAKLSNRWNNNRRSVRLRTKIFFNTLLSFQIP